MYKSSLVKRVTIKLISKEVGTIVLKQNEINITVRDELGHILLVDAADSEEMFLLASLLQHSMTSNDVIFLEREDSRYTDLLKI